MIAGQASGLIIIIQRISKSHLACPSTSAHHLDMAQKSARRERGRERETVLEWAAKRQKLREFYEPTETTTATGATWAALALAAASWPLVEAEANEDDSSGRFKRPATKRADLGELTIICNLSRQKERVCWSWIGQKIGKYNESSFATSNVLPVHYHHICLQNSTIILTNLSVSNLEEIVLVLQKQQGKWSLHWLLMQNWRERETHTRKGFTVSIGIINRTFEFLL